MQYLQTYDIQLSHHYDGIMGKYVPIAFSVFPSSVDRSFYWWRERGRERKVGESLGSGSMGQRFGTREHRRSVQVMVECLMLFLE